MDPILGDCSLDALLRTRTSEKWRAHPPDVLPAFVAEMDFEAAMPIVEAVTAAARRGDMGYPHPVGLYEETAAFMSDRFGWAPDPHHMTAAPDVMSGIAEVLHVATPAGSSVVINPPVYPPFFFRLRQTGRQLREVPLTPPGGEGDRYELDLDALDDALSDPAVSAYLLCSPHNPVGRVWEATALERVAESCARHGVTLLVDEIHAPLTMPGATFTPSLSLATRPAEGPRTFVFTSASKGWNIPGLKCGLIVAGTGDDAALLTERWEALFPSHLGAIATEAAFAHSRRWLEAVVAQLDQNRRTVTELLDGNLPGVLYREPEASFLAWLDCRALGLGDDPAAAFLERGRVALSRGRAFGGEGRGFVRLNFGTSPELVTEAVRRMAAALEHA